VTEELAELRPEAIRRIATRAVPGRSLHSFERLPGALSNSIYLLHFHDSAPAVVLRVYHRDPAAYRKEVELLPIASKYVAVPELIEANPQDDEIGPYIVYRYAEGVTFQQLKRSGNLQDMAEASFAIGQALACIQEIPFSALIVEEASPCSFDRFTELENLPLLKHHLGSRLTDRLHGLLFDWMPQLQALDEEQKLVHGDFHSRNIVVKKRDNCWAVSAILDWELAFRGSPLWDAARFVCFEKKKRPCREPHFSLGYREGGGVLPPDWSLFYGAMNAMSAAQSLCRANLPEQFIPELCELIKDIVEAESGAN
jgi:aminoglycoside phosphotransferase (APT) family kinase protein